MRLSSLNCQGGRQLEAVEGFLPTIAPITDVFCFQEVIDAHQSLVDARHPGMGLRGDTYLGLMQALPDFCGYFSRWEEPDRMSTAVFVRRSIKVLDVKWPIVYTPAQVVLHGHRVFSQRKLHLLSLEIGGRVIHVGNLHGGWNDGPKTDTPERLEQSRKVIEAFAPLEGEKVLAGDFNLLPETESVRMLVRAGFRDLITEYGVTSTRTPLYRHYDDPAEPNLADFIMPTAGLSVKRFEVLPDVVSDHSPLYAEFA